MEKLTGIERISNILKRKPVDRIGLHEHIWESTRKNWVMEGAMKEDEKPEDHFGFDIVEFNPFNLKADINTDLEVIEDNGETELVRDGNGVVFRQHKNHVSGRQYYDFMVKEKKGWEEHIKPFLKPDFARIDFEGYRKVKKNAREKGMFFVWSGLNVFELMRTVCGHEYMFLGMGLDPEWIKDMVETYSQLTVDLQEILFAGEGLPDGIWYSEDLGFKGTPFISPQMYKEIIQPGHKRTFEYAHSEGLPVIMHSCGMIEPLLPYVIESGIDCLEAIEVKAGMDLVKIHKEYGERLSFMGGIDVRILFDSDKEKINEVLEAIIPAVRGNYGYVLHSDHSIPDNVEYDVYKYFVKRGLELGTY